MAETEFFCTIDELSDFFRLLIGSHAVIVIDTMISDRGMVYLVESEIQDLINRPFFQAFLKHEQFSDDKFYTRVVDNINLGHVKIIDQRAGDGHLHLRVIAHRMENFAAAFLTVSYISFFKLNDDSSIPPSDALVRYYKNIVKYLKRRTMRIKSPGGRFYWVSERVMALPNWNEYFVNSVGNSLQTQTH